MGGWVGLWVHRLGAFVLDILELDLLIKWTQLHVSAKEHCFICNSFLGV